MIRFVLEERKKVESNATHILAVRLHMKSMKNTHGEGNSPRAGQSEVKVRPRFENLSS